jgi:hypothetical protein
VEAGQERCLPDAAAAAEPAPQPVSTTEPELQALPDGTLDTIHLPRNLGSQSVETSSTGAFQRLPMVAPSKELLESAVKRAARVPFNNKIKNEAQKAKNRQEVEHVTESIQAYASFSPAEAPSPLPKLPAYVATFAVQGGACSGHLDQGALRPTGHIH